MSSEKMHVFTFSCYLGWRHTTLTSPVDFIPLNHRCRASSETNTLLLNVWLSHCISHHLILQCSKNNYVNMWHMRTKYTFNVWLYNLVLYIIYHITDICVIISADPSSLWGGARLGSCCRRVWSNGGGLDDRDSSTNLAAVRVFRRR